MKENFMDILKALADKRMEMSLTQVRNNDPNYLNEVAKVIEVERKYESLELPSESRDLINQLLSLRDSINMEQNSLAYLSGLQDCVLILRELGMLEL